MIPGQGKPLQVHAIPDQKESHVIVSFQQTLVDHRGICLELNSFNPLSHWPCRPKTAVILQESVYCAYFWWFYWGTRRGWTRTLGQGYQILQKLSAAFGMCLFFKTVVSSYRNNNRHLRYLKWKEKALKINTQK